MHNALLLIAAVPQTRDALFEAEWHYAHGIGHMVIGTSKHRTGVRGVASGTVLFESECGTCEQTVFGAEERKEDSGPLSSLSELITTMREAATNGADPTTTTTRRELSETEGPGLALRYFLCTLIAKSIRMNHSRFYEGASAAAAADELPEDAPAPAFAPASPPPERAQWHGSRYSADGELLWVECDGLILDLTDKALPPWMVRAKPTLQSYVKQTDSKSRGAAPRSNSGVGRRLSIGIAPHSPPDGDGSDGCAGTPKKKRSLFGTRKPDRRNSAPAKYIGK